MLCPSCSAENAPSSVYCVRCNTALTPTSATFPGAYQQTPANQRGNAPRYGYEPTTPSAGFVAEPAQPRGPFGPWQSAAIVMVLLLVIGGVTAFLLRNVGSNVERPAVPAHVEAAGEPPQRVQASAIDELLEQSGISRRKLNESIELVNRCRQLPRAVADLQEVGTERKAQIDTVEAMTLSALDNGEQLRTTLANALHHSLAADAAYVEWAQGAQANGCKASTQRRAAYAEGGRRSAAAQSFKRSFLAAWDPVAVANGFDRRTTQDI